MINFLDGPAAGKTLMVKRAPAYLRVVIGRRSKEVDALDQLDDEPRATEDVFAYRLVSGPTRYHLRGRGISGCYMAGEYRLCAEQPADATLRDTAAWRAWAVSQGKEE